MPYNVTIFPDLSASKKIEKQLTLKHVAEPRLWPTKKNMPLVVMAKFGDDKTTRNSYRHDANVIESYGNALDYDNNDGLDYPFEKAMEILQDKGIEARGYTSPSHTKEHPRWRLIVPYANTYSDTTEKMKQHHRAGVQVVEELLGCTFAPESKRLSQSYYIGRSEQAESYSWTESTGLCIDELYNLPELAYLYSGNGYDSSDTKLDVKVALDNLEMGEDLHENILKLTAHYAKYNLPLDEIVQLTEDKLLESNAPQDARFQQRFNSIRRLAQGAIRKLESGEWDKLDKQNTAATTPEQKKKKKANENKPPITLDDFAQAFRVTRQDLAEIQQTNFIYKEIFRGPQMIAIAGPPSAGKTTVMEHIAAHMSGEFDIYYINADIASGAIPEAEEKAFRGGYKLLCPDIKPGLSMTDVVEFVTRFTDQGTDLTGCIFIFDTLKKMTDVINKAVAKDLYKMLRSLTTVCNATVICLAHTNKYDHDGWPMFEGTMDLRSDFDALGLLYPLKGDYGQITTALYWGQDDDLPWGKTRGRVDHAAWSMDTNDQNNRTVDQVKWIDTYALAKDQASTKRIEDLNIAIANVIHGFEGDPLQSDVIRLSGHPRRQTVKALKAGDGKYWTVEPGEAKAQLHILTETGLELIDVTTPEDDFSDLFE